MGPRVVTKAESLLDCGPRIVPPGLGVSQWTEFNWLRKDFLGYLEKGKAVGSEIVRLRPLPFNEIYLVTSIEVAREISGPLGHLFEKSGQTKMMVGKFLGNGLVLSEGERHLRDRKAISKLFVKYLSNEKTAALCEVVLAGHLVHRGVSFTISDIEAFWEKISFEIIGKGIFGEIAFEESTTLFAAMNEFADAMGMRFKSIPFPEWIPTSRNRKEKLAIDKVNRALKSAYDNCNTASFAGELKEYYKLIPGGKTQWVDQIKTLLFAGHETVAKLLSWAVYFYCSEDNLSNKIQTSLAHDGSGAVTWFVNEVLRMRPPVWLYDRAPKQDVVVGGYHIPKGKKVYISPYLYHHDQKHFDSPEKFSLGRFEDGESSKSFIPFGEGVRSCVGKQFALAETNSLLEWLFANYELRWSDRSNVVGIKTGATLGFDRSISIEFSKKSVK